MAEALACTQCPHNSNVIGTNYDGRTAGKIRLWPPNRLYCPSLALLFGLAAGIFVVCPGPAALASTTERVVVNRFSGLAIEGFDPVAYFIQKQPVLGLPDFEAARGRRGLALSQ